MGESKQRVLHRLPCNDWNNELRMYLDCKLESLMRLALVFQMRGSQNSRFRVVQLAFSND